MAPETAAHSDLLLAAIIGSARGLRGEVSAEIRTDRPEDVFLRGHLIHTNNPAFPELEVAEARYHNGRLFLHFVGIATREEAESLRGTEILVEGESEEDAWYAHELIGLPVVDTSGAPLGEVSGILPAPAQDLLTVKTAEGEVMVPLVEELVPTVSVEEGIVVVDPPLGLFPEPDSHEAQ